VTAYAIGAALLLGSLAIILKSYLHRHTQPSDAPFLMSTRDKVIAVAIGAIFGFVVGLTSVGSGTFFGLVMVMVYPLTIAKIVGTDIFHAAALLWVAGFGHLVSGNVDVHAMLWLLLGSIPGVLITSRYTPRIPGKALQLALATVLFFTGLKLVNVPEANWVLACGLIGAAAVFGGWALWAVRSGASLRAAEPGPEVVEQRS